MGDAELRAQIGPLPEFEPAFTPAPRLEDAVVAVVTTAGLMHSGDAPWSPGDPSFRMYNRSDRDLIVGNHSMNFDRSGVAADLNVVYPLDRLEELRQDGLIKDVAPHHLSFMGAMGGMKPLRSIMLDSGPAAAKLLLDDGVNVVILTPVCPGCARVVTVLGHVLEQHGLSTVVLLSIRPYAEKSGVPRALYCDFPLGRPLGKPGDPGFQRGVLVAALGLLDRPSGPVLEDYPEAISDEADLPLSCMLPPPYDPSLPPAVDEATALRGAWDRQYTSTGRTQIGRRLRVDDIPQAVERLEAVADGAVWTTQFASEDVMKDEIMDVRVFYEEAAMALEGHVPAARASEAWLFHKTELGKLLKRLLDVFERGSEPPVSPWFTHYLVPATQSDGRIALQ